MTKEPTPETDGYLYQEERARFDLRKIESDKSRDSDP